MISPWPQGSPRAEFGRLPARRLPDCVEVTSARAIRTRSMTSRPYFATTWDETNRLRRDRAARKVIKSAHPPLDAVMHSADPPATAAAAPTPTCFRLKSQYTLAFTVAGFLPQAIAPSQQPSWAVTSPDTLALIATSTHRVRPDCSKPRPPRHKPHPHAAYKSG